MTKEEYIKITEPLRQSPKATKYLHIANRFCTGAAYILYPALLIYLGFQMDPVLAKAIIVPMNSFIILSVVRYFINAKRPYEEFEIPPVIKKNTRGKSFPSRHVFCIFLIAMTFIAVSPWYGIGILLLVLGVFLAVIRVLAGVHYPRDVIAGAICGIAAAVLGFWIL